MSLNVNDIQNYVDNATLEDQTKDDFKGGFTYKKLPMGKHLVRLVQYIEYGNQPQPDYNGKPKDDAPMVLLTFEFLSKRCVEEKEDGTLYAPRKSVALKKSFNEKSAYRKLFEKMRAGDTTIDNMARMVGGHHWMMGIQWTTKDAEGKRIVLNSKNAAEYEARAEANPENKDFKIWDNMRNADGFMIGAATRDLMDEDGEPTGEQEPIPCRPHVGPLSLFVWNDPQPMLWDSIYIEGTYTKKVGDKEVEVSKNRHQEMCMAASNFDGSPLQAMLEGLDKLPGMVDPDDTQMPADEAPIDDDEKPEDKPAPAQDDDEFGELGL